MGRIGKVINRGRKRRCTGLVVLRREGWVGWKPTLKGFLFCFALYLDLASCFFGEGIRGETGG